MIPLTSEMAGPSCSHSTMKEFRVKSSPASVCFRRMGVWLWSCPQLAQESPVVM